MDLFFKKENRFPCPPNMNDIIKDVDLYIEEIDGKEGIEAAKETISCVEDYLNLYNMFVTGNPPEDNLVNGIYDKTKEMINEAIKSRQKQKEAVACKVNDYRQRYHNRYQNYRDYSHSKDLKEGIEEGISLLRDFDNDFKMLNDLKDYCGKAITKPEKILCVEKFVNAAHERGPYIPLGCGGMLPETVSQEFEMDEQISLIEEITPLLEAETSRVLDCLKEYKG